MTWPPESLGARIGIVLVAVLVMWRLCAWMDVPTSIALVAAGAAAIVIARLFLRAS